MKCIARAWPRIPRASYRLSEVSEELAYRISAAQQAHDLCVSKSIMQLLLQLTFPGHALEDHLILFASVIDVFQHEVNDIMALIISSLPSIVQRSRKLTPPHFR